MMARTMRARDLMKKASGRTHTHTHTHTKGIYCFHFSLDNANTSRVIFYIYLRSK